jgi:hypothetical protein
MNEADPGQTYREIIPRIRKRLQAAYRTTKFVWFDPDKLLMRTVKNTNGTEFAPTPPLEYFLIMVGLTSFLEKTLFSPLPSFEMPPILGFVDHIFNLLPELTVLISTFSVLLSTVGPWVASQLFRRPIPFDVLARAYAYQLGAILMPFVMLIQVVVIVSAKDGGRPAWWDYLTYLAVAISLLGGAWVLRQTSREGYDRRVHWAEEDLLRTEREYASHAKRRRHHRG